MMLSTQGAQMYRATAKSKKKHSVLRQNEQAKRKRNQIAEPTTQSIPREYAYNIYSFFIWTSLMDNYPLSSNFHFGNEMCWPYVDANDLIVFFHHIILIHLKHMQNVHNNKAQIHTYTLHISKCREKSEATSSKTNHFSLAERTAEVERN